MNNDFIHCPVKSNTIVFPLYHKVIVKKRKDRLFVYGPDKSKIATYIFVDGSGKHKNISSVKIIKPTKTCIGRLQVKFSNDCA
jgi:hypothetical protein